MGSDDSISNFRKTRLPSDPRELNEDDQKKKQDLSLIFQILEEQIMTFVKRELERFKTILSPNYQKNMEMKEDNASRAKEGALKMALHFLCSMNETDLANKLEENELDAVCQYQLKENLQTKYKTVFEGIPMQGSSTLLEKIYTDVYIIEGGNVKGDDGHEVGQIEYRFKRSIGAEKPIKCVDLFKPLSGEGKPLRRVMTKGIAGIGKTISVQKYILDWALGNENKEIHFIFPLSFRELNLMKDQQYSLRDLLHHFFPELKQVRFGSQEKYKVLFIFDGLDECRLELNFEKNETLTDVTVVSSLDALLTNIIKGNLLPSALLWITSRPAAANKIPPECVDLVTEVHGFNDAQKEEYFRKRVSNKSLASRIISHIKLSRSLHIMCHIPVFCWIAVIVLQVILGSFECKQIPKTLTEMYTYFLLFQDKQRSRKFHDEYDHQLQWNNKLLDLGKLAYEQLRKGNLIFYEEDLKDCGIDVSDVAIRSGMCTQIFREESGIFHGKVFCFVHLSVQEYLAAFYAFSMAAKMKNMVPGHLAPLMEDPVIQLHKSAVDKMLEYKDGRFDLVLRFLLGLSLESNQKLLHGLLPRLQNHIGNDETISYVKHKIREAPSSESVINLFHCLNELNDHTLVEEIQSFLSAGTLSEVELSPGQWSALVFVLLTSDQKLDMFDLKKYIRSDEGFLRLKPVAEESETILLDSCRLTERSCSTLASILCKTSSKVRQLDVSGNIIGGCGVKELCSGLKNPNCALEMLRLSDCGLTGDDYVALASVVKSSPHLKELDLCGNDPGDLGVKLFNSLLQDPCCKLMRLRLLSPAAEDACTYLTLLLGSNPLLQTELNLSRKTLGDSGVKKFCALLKDSHCRLKSLNLWSCSITEEGCSALTSALTLNPSHLRELNLSRNLLGDSGVNQISTLLSNPDCKLNKLDFRCCSITEEGCAALISALTSNPSHLIELKMNGNTKLGNSGVSQICALLRNPDCQLQKLDFGKCSITEEGCAALMSALTLNPSHLVELNLSLNDLGDSGAMHISALLGNPDCELQNLNFRKCSITEKGCAALTSALTSNPSHLIELNLSLNELGDSGVRHISTLLRKPDCKLQNLKLRHCKITVKGCSTLTSVLTSNTSHLVELNLRGNPFGESGLKQISDLLRNPDCKLKKLDVLP